MKIYVDKIPESDRECPFHGPFLSTCGLYPEDHNHPYSWCCMNDENKECPYLKEYPTKE